MRVTFLGDKYHTFSVPRTHSGNEGGTFYLMHTGDVIALPSPRGFEESYVLLNDASFFEVSAPLGAQDHAEATRFREIFRSRSGVVRVLYTASVGRRAMGEIARRVRAAPKFS